jgi:3-deoxy-D-manno-octulosonic-acid transferase
MEPKAKAWLRGRKNLFEQIKVSLKPGEYRAWFHCASAGEFEQGRPVIEAYKKRWPAHRIVLTFFSPSGYELRKNYSDADYIFYLPLDTRINARKFIELVQPRFALFVKYEFWIHHLRELEKNSTPSLLISAVFRPHQIFFRWYGKIFRDALQLFRRLFVQDDDSLKLLHSIRINQAEVAGDTRFDRVWEISGSPKQLPLIEKLKSERKLFVAGSTWHEDEELLAQLISSNTLAGAG